LRRRPPPPPRLRGTRDAAAALEALDVVLALGRRRPLDGGAAAVALLHELLEGHEGVEEHGSLRLEDARFHVVEEVGDLLEEDAEAVVALALLGGLPDLRGHGDAELAELAHFSEELDEPRRVVDVEDAWRASSRGPPRSARARARTRAARRPSRSP